MADVAQLLPPNRTPLEGALAQVIHHVEHDERAIPAARQPYATPGAVLPWLAWERDVLAWPRQADSTLQRAITAGSWSLHRRMGTLSALREVAGFYGAAITQVQTPPSKTFAGASLTRTQRDAFLARYPQLRLYPQRLTGQRVGSMLWGLHGGAGVYPVASDAAQRLAPQAFLWRAGEEIPLQSTERSTETTARAARAYTEVRRGADAPRQAFCGRMYGAGVGTGEGNGAGRWLGSSDAAARMYRVVVDTPYIDSRETLHRSTVQPGLDLIDVRYDWIAGRGAASGVHAGQHVAGNLRRSTARERIYKRLYLFDPAVAVQRRGAASYCDASILSMPAHHARLDVSVPGQLHARIANRYLSGFVVATDKTHYHSTLAAMRRVARASDRIAISTAVHRQITAGEAARAGTANAGAWTSNT